MKKMGIFSQCLRPYISENIDRTKKVKEVDQTTCHGQTFMSKTFCSKIILTLHKSASEEKGQKLPNLGVYRT